MQEHAVVDVGNAYSICLGRQQLFYMRHTDKFAIATCLISKATILLSQLPPRLRFTASQLTRSNSKDIGLVAVPFFF